MPILLFHRISNVLILFKFNFMSDEGSCVFCIRIKKYYLANAEIVIWFGRSFSRKVMIITLASCSHCKFYQLEKHDLLDFSATDSRFIFINRGKAGEDLFVDIQIINLICIVLWIQANKKEK